MVQDPTLLKERQRLRRGPAVEEGLMGADPPQRSSRWRHSVRWFAAELLVVVLGVLLALAANDQAQRLREQRLADEYTVRIVEDLDRFAVSLEGLIAWSRAVRAAGDLLVPVLEGADPGDGVLLVLAATYQAARIRRPDLSPIAYRELLATGQIRLFRDPELRQHLGGYFADLERSGEFLKLDEEYSAIVRRTLPLHVQTRIHDGCANTDLPQACPVDVDADEARMVLQRVAGQPGIAAALRLRLMHQHFTLTYAEQQYAANRSLRERLAAAEKPPERDRQRERARRGAAGGVALMRTP